MNTEKPKEKSCVCDELKQPGLCMACQNHIASFPDVLVERAAELGLLVLEYETVEQLERAIIEAERERDENAGPDDFTGATPGDR